MKLVRIGALTGLALVSVLAAQPASAEAEQSQAKPEETVNEGAAVPA